MDFFILLPLFLFQISDDTGEQFTFDEVRMMSIRAAQNLQRRGYTTKQVVGIMARNVPHLAPIVCTCVFLGCPINPMGMEKFDKSNTQRIFRLTEPCLIFCEVDAYDFIVECLTELEMDVKIFTFNGSKGGSEPVENLFKATGIEEDFV